MRKILYTAKNFFIADELKAEEELKEIEARYDALLSHPNFLVRLLAFIF